MGLDGGTIVTRSDVLRGQSWRVAQGDQSRSTRGGNVSKVPAPTVEKTVEREAAWSTCALSSQPLRPPIVTCALGRLYNKEAIIEFLLCKRDTSLVQPSAEALTRHANVLRVAAGTLDHIASLKDVAEVQLTPAREVPPAAAAAAGPSDGAAQSGADHRTSFVCPLTLLPCTHHPCSALLPCGHVVSDRAMGNLGGDASCPVCGCAFAATLPINGTLQQAEQLRAGLKSFSFPRAAKQGGKKRRAAGDGDAARKQAHAALPAPDPAPGAGPGAVGEGEGVGEGVGVAEP